MRVAVTEETKGVLVLEAVVVTLVAFVVEVVEFPEQAFDWDQRFFFFFFSPNNINPSASLNWITIWSLKWLNCNDFLFCCCFLKKKKRDAYFEGPVVYGLLIAGWTICLKTSWNLRWVGYIARTTDLTHEIGLQEIRVSDPATRDQDRYRSRWGVWKREREREKKLTGAQVPRRVPLAAAWFKQVSAHAARDGRACLGERCWERMRGEPIKKRETITRKLVISDDDEKV